jgi:hypothetical protein
MDWSQLLGQVVQTVYNNSSTPHAEGNDPGNLIGNLTQLVEQQSGVQAAPNADTLERIKQEIYNNPSTPHQPGNDPGGLIGSLESLFGAAMGGGGSMAGQQGVESASSDPYGDPGLEGGASQYDVPVEPASEDPYGDAASQQ